MRNSKSSMMIIGAALLAAAWLIKGADIMQNLGLSAKAEVFLLYLPAMLIFLVPGMVNKNFIACERRAWKRLFGR